MPQVSELYGILAKNLGWHKARSECLTRLLVSLMLVSRVNLTHVALGLGGKANKESCYRRLKRFFAQVNLDSKKVAQAVVGLVGLPDEPWVIIFDRTRWDLGQRANNILVLSVGVGDNAVPLFWKNIDKRGNSHAREHQELLEIFFEVFGRERIRLVLGDREFASREFMQYLQQQKILFCIRWSKRKPQKFLIFQFLSISQKYSTGLINQKNGLFHGPHGALGIRACRRNIDFKVANKFLHNILKINTIFSFVNFMLADMVDMLFYKQVKF